MTDPLAAQARHFSDAVTEACTRATVEERETAWARAVHLTEDQKLRPHIYAADLYLRERKGERATDWDTLYHAQEIRSILDRVIHQTEQWDWEASMIEQGGVRS